MKYLYFRVTFKSEKIPIKKKKSIFNINLYIKIPPLIKFIIAKEKKNNTVENITSKTGVSFFFFSPKNSDCHKFLVLAVICGYNANLIHILFLKREGGRKKAHIFDLGILEIQVLKKNKGKKNSNNML